MNITLNNTGITLTDSEMVELRKFAVRYGVSGKFYLAVDRDGDIDAYVMMPHMVDDYWNNTNETEFLDIRNSVMDMDYVGTWDESLTIVNVNQLLRCVPDDKSVPVAYDCSLDIKPKQADFLDELADLLARYDASILSDNNININVKGKIVGLHAIRGYRNKINTINARTIRKFRLRSNVV